jgi:hypothetical protein
MAYADGAYGWRDRHPGAAQRLEQPRLGGRLREPLSGVPHRPNSVRCEVEERLCEHDIRGPLVRRFKQCMTCGVYL